MKKSLLLILASLFAVFALTGCAEDSKNDTPASTPVDPELVQQIKQFAEGYYEITFFHTDGAGLLPMTNDCTEAVNQGLMEDTCTDTPTKGYGQITVDDNGNMKLITKIQMDLSSLAPILYSAGKNSQYNYTEYPLLPASSVDMTDITTGTITINANKAVKGTTGRDLATNTSDAAAEYSFTFNVSNNTITNKMITTTPESVTDLGLGSPTTNVTVVMKKIQTLPTGYTMDKDVRFPEPTNADIEASLGGGNEENPGGEGEDNPSEEPTPSPYMNLIGGYNVDSLTLGDSTQQNAGTANLNTQDTSLILGLNLSDGALKVFVYSEDPATLMASGFTPSVDEQGNTVVDFTLGSLATIKMTRNTPYNTVNTGIGSAQEAISLNINNGSNISAETTEFNVVVNHTSAENKYYNISFYDNSGTALGLPVGTYVGVGLSGPNSNFKTTRVNTASTSTSYSVDISSLTKTDNAEYVVVVEETDAEGSVSGAVTVGLLKLVVSSVQ